MSYRLTPAAQLQRRELLRERAIEAGFRSAEKLRRQIKAALDRIGGWAPPGAIRTDLADIEYRFVLVQQFWIIWRFGADRSDRIVIALIHARRGDILDTVADSDGET